MLVTQLNTYMYKQGSQFLLPKNSRLSPGFVQVKQAILRVILWTIFAQNGRHQRCSKITGVK